MASNQAKILRKQMNDLVVAANAKIRSVIASQSGSSRPARLNIEAVE